MCMGALKILVRGVVKPNKSRPHKNKKGPHINRLRKKIPPPIGRKCARSSPPIENSTSTRKKRYWSLTISEWLTAKFR